MRGSIIRDDGVARVDRKQPLAGTSRPLWVQARYERIFIHISDSPYVPTTVGVAVGRSKARQGLRYLVCIIFCSNVSLIRHQKNYLHSPNDSPIVKRLLCDRVATLFWSPCRPGQTWTESRSTFSLTRLVCAANMQCACASRSGTPAR